MPGTALSLLLVRVELAGSDREGSVYSLICLVMLGALMLVGSGDMMLLVLGRGTDRTGLVCPGSLPTGRCGHGGRDEIPCLRRSKVAMVLLLLSLAGIPPLFGFVGKVLLFGAAIGAGYTWLAVIGILNSVLALAVYLRIIVPMYQPIPDRATLPGAATGPVLTFVWILAAERLPWLWVWPRRYCSVGCRDPFLQLLRQCDRYISQYIRQSVLL